MPGWELTAHIVLSMGAAALLFAAAVTALLLLFLDRRLHTRRLVDLPSILPPIDALEKVMFRLIGAGFVLLSVALLTGFVFVTNLFEQHLIHKTVLSLAAWVIFGILLMGRYRYGWRGRSAVLLDAVGVRHARARLFRIEIRARRPCSAGTRADAPRENGASLRWCPFRRADPAAAAGRLLRRQRDRAHEPEPLPAQAPRQEGPPRRAARRGAARAPGPADRVDPAC